MAQDIQFDQRLRRLTRKHSRMARSGIVHRMGPDGLVLPYPRRRMPAFPLRGVAILIAAAFIFKAFLYASLGGTTYDERVARLNQGSVIEQGGAWVMQADPATIWIAGQINALRF